ncbi:MAG: GerW family sporulation protein [Oscillospiraceae bacterium]|nr:GerW family sporulation protein [Oscillospiraceae bacterium]
MSEHKINGFIGVSVEKIRSMVDTDTMIGNPIPCGDGVTVIPVSKISVGFASGGSDLPTRTNKEYFAGGAGAGMSVKPVGFLVINQGEVRMVQLSENGSDGASSIMNQLPDVIEKISGIFSKDKKEKSEKKEKVKVKKTDKSEIQEMTETSETSES